MPPCHTAAQPSPAPKNLSCRRHHHPISQSTPQAYTPGYTGPYDCVDPITGASTCDNYAYPFGDKLVNNEGMKSADAYAPFPNALLLNWATIFTLGLGNLCALDFQVGGCRTASRQCICLLYGYQRGQNQPSEQGRAAVQVGCRKLHVLETSPTEPRLPRLPSAPRPAAWRPGRPASHVPRASSPARSSSASASPLASWQASHGAAVSYATLCNTYLCVHPVCAPREVRPGATGARLAHAASLLAVHASVYVSYPTDHVPSEVDCATPCHTYPCCTSHLCVWLGEAGHLPPCSCFGEEHGTVIFRRVLPCAQEVLWPRQRVRRV